MKRIYFVLVSCVYISDLSAILSRSAHTEAHTILLNARNEISDKLAHYKAQIASTDKLIEQYEQERHALYDQLTSKQPQAEQHLVDTEEVRNRCFSHDTAIDHTLIDKDFLPGLCVFLEEQQKGIDQLLESLANYELPELYAQVKRYRAIKVLVTQEAEYKRELDMLDSQKNEYQCKRRVLRLYQGELTHVKKGKAVTDYKQQEQAVQRELVEHKRKIAYTARKIKRLRERIKATQTGLKLSYNFLKELDHAREQQGYLKGLMGSE